MSCHSQLVLVFLGLFGVNLLYTVHGTANLDTEYDADAEDKPSESYGRLFTIDTQDQPEYLRHVPSLSGHSYLTNFNDDDNDRSKMGEMSSPYRKKRNLSASKIDNLEKKAALSSFKKRAALSSFKKRAALSSFKKRAALSSFKKRAALSSFKKRAALSSFKKRAALSSFKKRAALASFKKRAALASFKKRASLSFFKKRASLSFFKKRAALSSFRKRAALSFFKREPLAKRAAMVPFKKRAALSFFKREVPDQEEYDVQQSDVSDADQRNWGYPAEEGSKYF